MSTTFDSVERSLLLHGFSPVAQNFRWGHTPSFKHRDGRIRFIDKGQILTPKQLYDDLLENWQPSTTEDSLWKEFYMRDWFATAMDNPQNWCDRHE